MVLLLKNRLYQTVTALIITIIVMAIFRPIVSAETIKELQAKSQELQSQIEANNGQITELSKQVDSLQGKIRSGN